MSNQSKDALSINRFKGRDISELTEDEYSDYVLAKLMQETIQSLEGSIPSDRMYDRAKYNVMSAFWQARELLVSRGKK